MDFINEDMAWEELSIIMMASGKCKFGEKIISHQK